MAGFVVPPGGFTGFAQMTAASQRALSGSRTARSGRRRRRKGTKAKRRTRARVKRSGRSKGRKMKFGSPAWQKKYKVGKYRK